MSAVHVCIVFSPELCDLSLLHWTVLSTQLCHMLIGLVWFSLTELNMLHF